MMPQSGDAENPDPPEATSNQHDVAAAGATNKKWKIIALSAFLIAAAVAIAVGVTLANKGNGSGGDISTSQIIAGTNNEGMNNDGVNNDGMNILSTTEMTLDASALVGPTWYVVEFLGGNGLVSPLPQSTITLIFQRDGIMSGNTGCNDYFMDYDDMTDSSFKVEGGVAVTRMKCEDDLMKQEESYLDLFEGRTFWSNDVARSPIIDYAISEDGALELSDDDGTVIARCADSDPTGDTSSPPVFEAQYIRSVGPIESRVRIANPGVANGYSSCSDLKDDILNALKYEANSRIVSQRKYSWVKMCRNGDSCIRDDMCQSQICTQGVCARNEDLVPSPSPTSGSTPTVGSDNFSPTVGDSGAGDSVVAEDSFETNTQVDGVDEADVVKANADYTFAAYGDVLWTWNSTDASEGMMSMTPMSKEPEEECTRSPTPVPGPTTPFPTEDRELGRSAAGGARRDGPTRRNARRRESSAARRLNPCFRPKAQIHSLLLAGPHLTAIVSMPDDWEPYSEGSFPIISNGRMVIRVYDAENVPTNGGRLKLLGEQDIRGDYYSARSIGSKGFVISQLIIQTWQLIGDAVDRRNTQYCGLNDLEYEKMAAENFLANVDAMAERVVGELALQMDGTCDNFFQIASMQSGNSDESHEAAILNQIVQVTAFDMSSDFASPDDERPPKIPTDVVGAFSSGGLWTVYASQDLVASVSVGSKYDQTSGEWGSATFIQGFDIGGAVPRPFSYAELPGAPLNQYSVDLYKNHLRVVTTESPWWERKTLNKLWVLKVPERDSETAASSPQMELTGETGHLGKPNEKVFAVRFMGDKAYVVTFENTDPFYVLNVADPTNPIVIGELQIPGFSSYLHPIKIDGVDMMIGVGRHVDPASGRNDGAKISLFDVSDPINPTEAATYIDMGAYSSAGNDFYSFRYLDLNRKLILPKSKWSYEKEEDNFDGFIVYDVELGSISPRYQIQHADPYDIRYGCWSQASMPARSLVFRTQLVTIQSHSVIGTNLGTGGQNWNVSLDEGLDKAECTGYFW